MKQPFANPTLLQHHALARAAAAHAERVLPLFEQACPHDERPRLALGTLRAWVQGQASMPACRAAALAAHAAARAATEPAAVAAARAAGQAAAVAHMYTHAPHAATYAAKATALATGPAPVGHEPKEVGVKNPSTTR